MIQTNKQPMWVDESGNKIPFNRLTSIEKNQEKQAARIVKEAERLNGLITAFKSDIKTICEKVYTDFMESKSVNKPAKGNFTWFNFDRSIKIEVSINDRIEFDNLTMKACKEKFDEFLGLNLDEKQAFVKELINEAFSTSRGKLDAKKVMSLMKYRTKIKDTLFQEALDLLEQSIRRPDSRTYFRVWKKADDGQYKNIDLNFSSI